MLQTQNLKKYFGGVKAVNGCSFEVKKNTITALIGPNGSGKSTVFNLISGILKPDSGKIIFDKNDITNKKIEDISNLGISRLFQQSRLFKNLTVKENLLISMNNNNTKFWKNIIGYEIKKEDEDNIKEISKLVGIEDFLNKPCKDLSFGQKRLAEIARAILKPHTLLMLDEPVAGVNPRLRKEISDLLLKLKQKGDTILLIEHDMNFTLKISDKVIVMDEGDVIAHGTPKDIKNNKMVLEAYLGE